MYFAGVIDNSGIRVSLTKTLRPIEVSLLSMGLDVNFKHVIPPFQEAFISKSYCSQKCIGKVRTDMIYISRDMRFPTMRYVRPAKPQISLRIRAV